MKEIFRERDSGADVRAGQSKSSKTSQRQISRLRRVLVAGTAIGISVLFSLVILEFGLARFYYSNIDELRQDEFDSELGWRLKPGDYTVKPPQAFFTNTVSINQFGIRGRALTPAAPAGTRRVVVLGDSFTFGQAIDDETLFTTQLERRLNQSRPDDSFEVINAGVPGYGTAQELIMLRRLANAGIVGETYVLNMFTNDILDNLRLDYASRSKNPVQPGFELGPGGSVIFAHEPQRVLRGGSNLVAVQRRPFSMLFSVAKVRLQSFAQTKPSLVRFARNVGVDIKVGRVPGIISAWYDPDVLDEGVPLMKALLAEIDATVKGRQGMLLVALIPSPMQVYTDTYGQVLRDSFPGDPTVERFLEDPTRAQRIIRDMCEELGLPFLDMYEVLARQQNRSFYFPVDGHFNKAGHTVFAESLERFVKTHSLSGR